MAKFSSNAIQGFAQSISSIGQWLAVDTASIVGPVAYAFTGIGLRAGLALLSVVRSGANAIRRVVGLCSGSIYRLSLNLKPIILTLTEDSGLVRVVAFRGDTVIAWSCANLERATASAGLYSRAPEEGTFKSVEPGESDSPGPIDRESAPEELVDDLGQVSPQISTEEIKHVEPTGFARLMAEMPTRRVRLVTGLPIYAALIRHFPLPDKVRKRYLERMIVAEVLDGIPFEEDEVDISWRLRRDTGSHEALAIAVPKASINSQVKLAGETGLKPKAAYAQATALTLMADADDAIVVHLEPDHLAVVLVREGLPLVVHQQPFPASVPEADSRTDPSAVSGLDARCNALSGALDQVLGYYLSLGPQEQCDDLPVVLVGQQAGLEELLEALPRVLGRQVRIAQPAVKFPTEFPWGEYVVNIGLLLADNLRGDSWGKSSKQAGAAVNVLPQHHSPTQTPLVPVIGFAALVSLVVLAFSVGGAVQERQVEAHLLSLAREIRLDQEREQRLFANIEGGLASRLAEARGRELALTSGLGELKLRIDTLVSRLNTITRAALPPGVQLTSMVPERAGIALAGNAGTYEAILQYASNLRQSGLFQNVTVLQAAGSGRENLGFTVMASIPEPLEDGSGRVLANP